jgi:phosphatidylglycerophosphate synthase
MKATSPTDPGPGRFGPAYPLAVLGAALVALATGSASWLGAGGLAAVVVAVVLPAGPWRDPSIRNAANALTAARLAAVATLPMLERALVYRGFAAVVLAVVLLDGADGWLARRRGTITEFGARFDRETDALLVMVLCVLLHQTRGLPPWILVAGAWRYAYGALVAFVPGRGEAPRSSFGRHVAGVIMLALCSAFALGARAASVAAVATALISLSFIRGLWWSYGPRRA